MRNSAPEGTNPLRVGKRQPLAPPVRPEKATTIKGRHELEAEHVRTAFALPSLASSFSSSPACQEICI